MDKDYYSENTINKFIKEKLCDNNPVLYSYYLKNDIKNFRKHVNPKNDKNIDQVVYTYVTDSTRDIILDIIGELTLFLKPMGDLIITGGEAFNTYFKKEDRVVTSDIDTKFVPHFVISGGKSITPRNPKFFGYLQVTKLLLWNKLGQLAQKYQKKLYDRIKLIRKTKVGKFLGIAVPPINKNEKDPWTISRRYSLIKKRKQGSGLTSNNVLIDVELFALDMALLYFLPETGRQVYNLGGILDIAFMRPYELGYDVINSRERGLTYRVPTTGEMKYNKNILIASPRFLVDDLYLMKSLKLRPTKVKKDRKRLISFAKQVLNIKNITNSSTNQQIYKKSIRALQSRKKTRGSTSAAPRPLFTRKYVQQALKVNPYQYLKYTTPSDVHKLLTQYVISSKLPRKNFIQSSGTERFNIKSKKWVKNRTEQYIKNEKKYRLNTVTEEKFNYKKYPFPATLRFENVLYGYNPQRNKGVVNKKIFQKSATIPFTRPFLFNKFHKVNIKE